MNPSDSSVNTNTVPKSERKKRRKEYRKIAELQTKKETEERTRWLEEARPKVVEIEKRLELNPSLKLSKKDWKILGSYYYLSGKSTTRPRTLEEAKMRGWKELMRFKVISESKELSTIFWNQAGIHLDFSPSSLEVIDSTPFLSRLRDPKRVEDWGLTGIYYYYFRKMIGSYFGMVIVRNLGGEWRYPSRLLRIVAFKCLYFPWFFDRFFVVVNGVKIPVMRIVRLWCDGSGRVPSLAEAYETIKRNGMWP